MKTLTPHSQLEDYFINAVIHSNDESNLYKVEDFKLDKSVLLSQYNVSKKDMYEKLLYFKHPNIIGIDKIFEKNQQLYTISKLSNDIKLEKYLLSNSFSESEINTNLNSMLDMMIQLKNIELSFNIKIDNLVVNRDKNILLDNALNLINYSNDEQMIYELGTLMYLLITKEIYKGTDELKPSQKYSRALCGLVNRMLGINSNKKFKTLTELKILIQQSVKFDENSCEPIVCEQSANNPFSKFLSLMAVLLIISAGLYVVLSDKKILKPSEMGLVQSIQFHIAGYMNKSKAQYALGEMYEKGYVVDVDLKESLSWYEKSANNDNVYAKLYLGYLYQQGEIVPKDIYKAIYWYEEAAKDGSEYAQYNLGQIYYKGSDVQKDIQKAIKWFELAARQDYKKSYYILGLLYLNSDGDEIDYKKSFDYFSKGLDSNDSYSQMAVAYMYQNGYGVIKDSKKAISLYEEAAKNSHKVAQYNLARVYHYGKGVKVDKKKARYWYTLASKQGYKEAVEGLKKLNQKPKKKYVKKKPKVQETQTYYTSGAKKEYEEPKSISYGRFIDRGEFVEDTKSGLFWQKDGRQSGRLNFYQAKEYANNLYLGGVTGWRVPTAKELETIFPALDEPFINTPYTDKRCCKGPYEWRSYWTSELDNSMKDYAYLYHWHGDGGRNNCYASKNYVYVRCVHD